MLECFTFSIHVKTGELTPAPRLRKRSEGPGYRSQDIAVDALSSERLLTQYELM